MVFVPISCSISLSINVTSALCSFPLWLWKCHQVGGYWDKSCSTVTQLKEGLNRILCLIPYNVISQSVWECIMPEWLEAIRTEVPDNQLKEFREVLRWVSSLMKLPLIMMFNIYWACPVCQALCLAFYIISFTFKWSYRKIGRFRMK